MAKPKIAGIKSIKVELEADKPYFYCTCGYSAKQPFCDGSHKGSEFGCQQFTVTESKTASLCTCKRTSTPPFCDGAHKELCEQDIGTEA
jgi:CDGSH-type Zn-finger protein